MNYEESRALDHVIDHYLSDECDHAHDAGNPPGHIADSLSTLHEFRARRPAEMDAEANCTGDSAAGSPIGIVRDHLSHNKPEDVQEPSVEDQRRIEIETRWAKETIAMVAVELNEAYAQFVITSDGYEKPTGKLCGAFRQLEEAMQRLGINTETDPIPF